MNKQTIPEYVMFKSSNPINLKKIIQISLVSMTFVYEWINPTLFDLKKDYSINKYIYFPNL